MPTGHRGFVRGLEAALTACALVVVVWFYHWTVASSGGFLKPGEEDYYNFLVRGWRSGHLYMSKEPRPEMHALADPYDPAQNHAVRMGDASYFRGRYYLYFGAAPAAVLMLPYGLLTGRELATTSAIFAYCTVGFLALSGLWLAIRRRYFPGSAFWISPLVVLMLGLCTHVLVLQRRPLVWELPISSGFAFSMLALVALYRALHGNRPVLGLGAAGLSYGLAIASRPTCLFGALMFLPVLWQLRRTLGFSRQWWRGVIAAAGALTLCGLAVLAHNYARFGDPLEFGINYQLTSNYESKERHFSLTYLAHNAYIYYLHPGAWTTQFPFVQSSSVPGGPPGYLGAWVEGICGLAVTLPFLWSVLALPLAVRGREAREKKMGTAFIAAVGVFFAAVTLFYFSFYCATPRYMAEFTPALTLLAGCGALGLARWARSTPWRMPTAIFIGLSALVSLGAGLCVNFDYHGRSLRSLQPATWAKLEAFFSSTAAPTGSSSAQP